MDKHQAETDVIQQPSRAFRPTGKPKIMGGGPDEPFYIQPDIIVTLTRSMIEEISRGLLDPKCTGHDQRLDVIANVLGFESHDAMMSRLPEEETEAAVDELDVSHLTPITANAYSDDSVVDVYVDARHHLASASLESLKALMEEEWSHSYAADQIYLDAEAGKCPEALKLADYLAKSPKSITGETIGFEVYLDEDDALEWLRAHRPEIHKVLEGVEDLEFPEDDPQP